MKAFHKGYESVMKSYERVMKDENATKTGNMKIRQPSKNLVNVQTKSKVKNVSVVENHILYKTTLEEPFKGTKSRKTSKNLEIPGQISHCKNNLTRV